MNPIPGSGGHGFRFGKTFLIWNLFGIADFIDAVFLGTQYL